MSNTRRLRSRAYSNHKKMVEAAGNSPASHDDSTSSSLRAFQTICLGCPDDDLQAFRSPRSYFQDRRTGRQVRSATALYGTSSATRTTSPGDGCLSS